LCGLGQLFVWRLNDGELRDPAVLVDQQLERDFSANTLALQFRRVLGWGIGQEDRRA
jgi:hypothetical protein